MKNVTLSATTLAIATAAVALSSAPAQAAPAQHTYAHGTTRSTSFGTARECAGYASWSVKNVQAKGGKLVAGNQDQGTRTNCFPTANGRWTYLTLYTAAKPVGSGDMSPSQSGDPTWIIDHLQSDYGQAKKFTMQQCLAMKNAYASKVNGHQNLRLLPSQSHCGGGEQGDEMVLHVGYLASRASDRLDPTDVTYSFTDDIAAMATELGYATNAS